MLTPEQSQVLSSTVSQLGPSFTQNLGNLMGGTSQEDMQKIFQQTYVDPAMMQLERNILPAVQQRFTDANAGSSSALNQALAQSAADVSTMLGSQYGQFMQNQQQNQLQALGLLPSLMTNQTFTPLIQERQGLAGPLITAFGNIAGAAMKGGGGAGAGAG